MNEGQLPKIENPEVKEYLDLDNMLSGLLYFLLHQDLKLDLDAYDSKRGKISKEFIAGYHPAALVKIRTLLEDLKNTAVKLGISPLEVSDQKLKELYEFSLLDNEFEQKDNRTMRDVLKKPTGH